MTKKCFVIMPYGQQGTIMKEENRRFFYDVIKPVAEEVGYQAVRADEAGLRKISKTVVLSLAEAPLVIADLTGASPNVFYELGIRHTLEACGTILITREPQEKAVFSIQEYPILQYIKADEKEFCNKLRDAISCVQKACDEGEIDNPVHDHIKENEFLDAWLRMMPLMRKNKEDILDIGLEPFVGDLNDVIKPKHGNCISWSEYWNSILQIVEYLEQGKDSYIPDVILGLSNGGMAYGDFIRHQVFDEAVPPVVLASLWVDRSNEKPTLDNPFNSAIVNGLESLKLIRKRKTLQLLLVDDYIRTGETVSQALQFLKSSMEDAILFYLPLFCVNLETLYKNRETLIWEHDAFEATVRTERNTKGGVVTLHQTSKYILPYGKDMLRSVRSKEYWIKKRKE